MSVPPAIVMRERTNHIEQEAVMPRRNSNAGAKGPKTAKQPRLSVTVSENDGGYQDTDNRFGFTTPPPAKVIKCNHCPFQAGAADDDQAKQVAKDHRESHKAATK